MLKNYITVFEISESTNDILVDLYFRMFVGVVVFSIGIIWLSILFVRYNKLSQKKINVTAVYTTVFGAIWLIPHVALWYFDSKEIDYYLSIYKSGASEIVEGIVIVEHSQPKSGHAKGDIVRIGNKYFEIDKFRKTPGYMQTISHGGVLKSGVYARIHYADEVILKVESLNIE